MERPTPNAPLFSNSDVLNALLTRRHTTLWHSPRLFLSPQLSNAILCKSVLVLSKHRILFDRFMGHLFNSLLWVQFFVLVGCCQK